MSDLPLNPSSNKSKANGGAIALLPALDQVRAELQEMRKFRFARMLFEFEVRRHDLRPKRKRDQSGDMSYDYRHGFATTLQVLSLIVGLTLGCGRLNCPIPEQKTISRLTCISKSHVSEALRFLRSKHVLRESDGHYVLELDSKEWRAEELQPLTREVLEDYARLCDPDAQLRLDFKEPDLKAILAQLFFENLPTSAPSRTALAGTSRGASRDIIDVPVPGAGLIAGPATATASVPPNHLVGVDVDRLSAGDQPAGSSNRTDDAAPGADGKGEKVSDVERGFQELKRRIRDLDFPEEVPQGGTLDDGKVSDGHRPTLQNGKSSAGRNSEVPERGTTAPESSGARNSTNTRARGVPCFCLPVSVYKDPSPCLGTGETGNKKQCLQPAVKTETDPYWSNDPNPMEKGKLKRIADAVGESDVEQWRLSWLNRFVRKFPWEVIQTAVEDTIIAAKEKKILKTPSAFLKYRITERNRERLRRAASQISTANIP